MFEKDLKIPFTGSYQLSQAVSYLAEMIRKNGQVNLQYVKDQTNVLKSLAPSRQIVRKVYKCFIKYKPNSVGIFGILEYECDCGNGNRTTKLWEARGLTIKKQIPYRSSVPIYNGLRVVLCTASSISWYLWLSIIWCAALSAVWPQCCRLWLDAGLRSHVEPEFSWYL